MYIGRDVDNISNVEKLDNITFDGSATYALEKSSVAYTPSGANNILISIDGVVQMGNFSVSTTNIVFDWSPTSSNTCDWILHIGVGLISTPADSSVTASKLGSLAVTGAKLNTDVISAQTELAVAPADADEFMVSDGGVLKRIDYSLIKAANTPAFYAFLNTNQTAGTGADTIITLNAEALDTDNAFNTSTYKFTPQTAGKYFLYGQAQIDSGTDFNMLTNVITLNGSQLARGHNYNENTNTVNVSTIADMNGSSDYIQMFAMQNSGGDLDFAGSGTQAASTTYLMGYKLIGV